MFRQKILENLKEVISELGYKSDDIVLSIPKNSSFGDYTTNIALQLANPKSESGKQNPMEIAKKILKKLGKLDYLEKTEIAGSGFINFFIKDSVILNNIEKVCNYSSFVNPSHSAEASQDEKRKIMVEYASFNALKPVHVGHLRNIVLGESVSRLLESQGNEVFRVTYSSDIGLPSAKVIWGLKKLEASYKKAKKADLKGKMDFLGKAYVKGSTAYEDNEEVKREIDEINKKIYQRDKDFVPLWKEILGWTFEYFNSVYEIVGTKFDGEFLESEVEGPGSEIVRDNIGKVFERDQGAIIFPGEKYGLHNRVFLTSAGNPTYEAKDMGLARMQYEKFAFDLIIHVVARDQEEYFKVIFKALEQLEPEIAAKEKHLSYGYVNLPSGKMSSRTGNVLTLTWLIDEVKNSVREIMDKSSEVKTLPKEEKNQVINTISIGALKFSMLKYAPQTDMTFDMKKSVSLEGDSGPYLQYTYARAKSVLRNASFDYNPETEDSPGYLEAEERSLLRLIEHFEAILEESSRDFAPHNLAEYLLDLAKAFNLFYQKHQIIKDEKSEFRLGLTCAVAVTIKQGLYLLGIDSPERM